MTSTNYLSPEDFKKMVDAIPLVTEYNNGKLLSIQKNGVPNPKELQACLWVQYCHALRVSEVLSLHPNDFNFDRRILTLGHTKTGFKKCKKCKGKGDDCTKCDGTGKVRTNQYTSIPPDLPSWVIDLINSDYTSKDTSSRRFQFTRQLIWSYVKKAAKFAELELGEQQDERYIEGAWTHLIRKSRAKMMIEKGAAEVMVKVKLRHTFSVTERYTKPDINALIKWERENIVG